MIVRRMLPSDVGAVAAVHRECFPYDGDSEEDSRRWVEANFSATGRCSYFVLHKDGVVDGYILWVEQGGFRKEAVLELEQIGVKFSIRGHGYAKRLINGSLFIVASGFAIHGRTIKSIKVTMSKDNLVAQHLYEETLGAKVVATIPSLFEGDEVVMIARWPKE